MGSITVSSNPEKLFVNIAEPYHLDLNGNSFELPTFTMKEIYDAIPLHCFKPSIGFVFTGIWILAHECGHGAFSKSKKLNWTMGMIMHSFLLVPFHSWRLTHSQHHKSTGNIEKDTAHVPHTKESWLKAKFGKQVNVNVDGIGIFELAEDSPIMALYQDLLHQLFGWPAYLIFNASGQEFKTMNRMTASHFYFGKDSVLYKKNEIGLIIASDIGVASMIVCLIVFGQLFGSWNVIVLWGIPWLWTNSWIVAITFLQHTDASLPHYDNNSWTFPRGAAATIDRDLGFIDRHFFHNIIGTHVCHHLISTIPFYHALEASVHIRRVMGKDYKADVRTNFWVAFWRNRRTCSFVQETEGREGTGVYMFRSRPKCSSIPLGYKGAQAGAA
ncbi:hypothetical protein AA313_de0201953 [Arthrobotrys entomopaga]|nr:hypothetical protein AA313_de0201953 [Arthrobotrys entomopaga]